MPEITDEELASLKEHEKERKRLETELSKAKTSDAAAAIGKQLDTLKRDLKDDIESLHAADKAEREALRQELEKVKADADEARKKAEERSKIDQGSGTMVIPPSDLGRQPPPTEEGPTGGSGPEPEKTKWWKSVW
jgi:septal ring factor EnvC (AmiA/AmiB activator)